jgi:hypothetical protein
MYETTYIFFKKNNIHSIERLKLLVIEQLKPKHVGSKIFLHSIAPLAPMTTLLCALAGKDRSVMVMTELSHLMTVLVSLLVNF